jgi:Domain of unknown function (DUF5753)
MAGNEDPNPAAWVGRDRSWQSQYRDVASPQLLQFIGFEEDASTTRNFQPLLVPGLLQTREYAQAVLGLLNPHLAGRPADTDALLACRMRRQELLQRDNRPELFFILDEAVTRRQVGGAATMHGQLRRLAELSARPRITIEVLPYSAGAHLGLSGPFVIHQLADPARAGVLFQEGPQGDAIRDADAALIAQRLGAFEELRGITLGPASADFLSQLADEQALRRPVTLAREQIFVGRGYRWATLTVRVRLSNGGGSEPSCAGSASKPT